VIQALVVDLPSVYLVKIVQEEMEEGREGMEEASR